MAVPSSMPRTYQATVTTAEGYTTDAASEFWQRVGTATTTAGVFIVYEGVPAALSQNILQSGDPDTAIALRLASYPRRIASV